MAVGLMGLVGVECFVVGVGVCEDGTANDFVVFYTYIEGAGLDLVVTE